MTESLAIFVEKDRLLIQSAPYIEHGWYVIIDDEGIALWEIPYGGGEPQKIGKFKTLFEAIEESKNLT